MRRRRRKPVKEGPHRGMILELELTAGTFRATFGTGNVAWFETKNPFKNLPFNTVIFLILF